MTKSKHITIAQAFTMWMKGESFAALTKIARPKLRQANFKKLAGVETWAQAVAKRTQALKAVKKASAA